MSAPGTFVFDAAGLTALARAKRDAYVQATPFPHAVFDNFLPEDVAARLVEEFPRRDSPVWVYNDRPLELEKVQLSEEVDLPPFTRQVAWAFNSAVFVRFLTELTGIHGLIADSSLWGGGLHQTRTGGLVKVHSDFHRHPVLELDRRLNVILFLNPEWRAEWGGALELWPPDMSRSERSIMPALNRCVIFATDDRSPHGHPDPLACPADVTRNSMAFYYYSNGRPASEIIARMNTTLFRRRPGTDEADNLFTLRLIHYLRKCVPPIAVDIKRRFFGRRGATEKIHQLASVLFTRGGRSSIRNRSKRHSPP